MEYRNILRLTQETPTSLRNRVKYLKEVYSRYREQSEVFPRVICDWWFRLPRNIAIVA